MARLVVKVRKGTKGIGAARRDGAGSAGRGTARREGVAWGGRSWWRGPARVVVMARFGRVRCVVMAWLGQARRDGLEWAGLTRNVVMARGRDVLAGRG